MSKTGQLSSDYDVDANSQPFLTYLIAIKSVEDECVILMQAKPGSFYLERLTLC